MDPWNASIGSEVANPVVKCTTAGAESVPPAPWVKINAGREDGVECRGGSWRRGRSWRRSGGRERRQGIGVVGLVLSEEGLLGIVNEEFWWDGEG
jgi:hypothetical protein